MSLKQIGGNFNFDKISGVWDLEDQLYVNKTIGQIDRYTSVKSSSKFWPASEVTEQSFTFDYSGTKALICGLGGNIFQFRSSIPHDPSTLTKDIDTFNLPNNPTAITFGNSGNFLYTSNSTTIYQYTCVNGPYDITNLSLTNTFVAQAGTTGAALVFKSDGSRLFTASGNDGIVHSYTVGNGIINQWNLSAATYDSTKKYTHFNNISSLTFSSDGTKMYLGDNNNTNKGIIKYNLSPAWDISTASNSVDVYDLSISSATNSTGTSYGATGSILYVMRDSGQVTQLNLGTPYRVNNVTSFVNKTTQADSKTTGYRGLYFKSDGSRYWTINSSGGNQFLYEFQLSNWDISGATYTSKSIDLSTQLFDYATSGGSDSIIKGVAFNDAGTKLYLIGDQRDFIYEIDLETAWDINTANFQVYRSPLIEPVVAPNHCDVTYGNSGNKMYVVISNAPARIQQYDLNIPFDISRLTNPSKSKDISAQTTAPKAVRFNSTGTKMFVLGTGAGTATVYQYTLNPGWDVSTASYDSVSFSVYTQATDPRGLAFKDDGTKMYIANRVVAGDDVIYQYSISTGFDLGSTVTYDTVSLNIAGADTEVGGIILGDSGSKLYVTGATNDNIRQYNLPTAWILTGGTLQTTPLSVSAIYANPSGIDISSDGKTIIVSGGDGATLYSTVTAIKLPTAWNISSFAVNSKRRAVQTTTSGLTIGDSDDEIYYGDNTTATSIAIQRLDLTTPGFIAGGATATTGYTKAYGTTIEDLSVTASYMAYVSANKLFVLTLTTPYDITSSSVKDDFFETNYISNALQISSDGTNLYNFYDVAGTRFIYRYPLPTSYDVDSIVSFTTKNTNTLTHLLEAPTTTKFYSDIFLSPDGNSLYILADTYEIAKLRFGTAYDVTTLFSYFQPFSSAKCIRFNSTGTSLFILAGTTITQWSLPTPFNIFKYTNIGSLSVAIDNTPTSFAVATDSSRFYVLGDETNKIHEYRMKTSNDITTGYYFDRLSVSAQNITTPQAVTFGDNGRKVYVLNNADDTIYQYSIPIQYNAWDIKDAVYDNKSFNVSGIDTDPQDIRFMDDGKSFIMIGLTGARLIQVYVETAWDISTAWYQKTRSISSQDAGGATSISFGDDGKKMYAVGNNNDRIYQYSMPLSGGNTTWDISGSVYDNKSFLLPEGLVVGAHLNPSSFVNSNGDTIPAGTRLLMMGDSVNAFYQRNLSTPWDISTAYAYKTITNADDYDFSSPTAGVLRNLRFGGSGADQGKKLYILGDTRDCIIQYALSTAYDLTTATYVARYDITGHNLFAAALTDIHFNDTGTRVYIVDDSNNRIFELRLNIAWDITTAKFVPVKTWPNGSNTNASGITFNSGEGGGEAGKKLYVSDYTGSTIYQYQLSTAWDINTITNYATPKSVSVSALDGAIDYVELSSDGTRIYFGGANSDRIFERKLTVPYEISSASNVSNLTLPYNTFTLPSPVANATAFTFAGSGANEGKILYVLCNTTDTIYQYSLGTAWDISTATTPASKTFVHGNETAGTGFDISDVYFDGTNYKQHLYLVGQDLDRIYRYTITAATSTDVKFWDISQFGISDQNLLVTPNTGLTETLQNSLKVSRTGSFITLVGQTNDDVYIYNMPTAYNLTGATLVSGTRDVSAEGAPTGVAVAYGSGVTEGTTFYVLGTGSDTIRKYTASTAFGGTWSEVTSSALLISFVCATPVELCVSKGGDYIYVLDTNIIYRFTMETAHESKTANIGTLLVSGQDATHSGLRFSSDGTKMFMLGNTNDDIFRYDLTKAWVASSATFVSTSAITIETASLGFDINNDGTKYYAVGATEIIRQYIPSVAFGTTLSTSTTKDIEWIMTNDAESIKFSNDGLRVFVADAGRIYQFDLDAAFNIASLNMQYYNVGLEDTTPGAMFINPAGTRMVVAGTLNDTIRTYTLNYPYNISSASLTNTSPTMPDGGITGISFNSDGSKFYTIGQGTTIDAIRQFNASNYSVTSAATVKQVDLVNYANPYGMCLSHTGKQLFFISSTSDINQVELDNAFEIDSLYIDQINQSIDSNPLSFFVDKSGLRGIFFGSFGDTIRALTFVNKWNITGYTNSSTQSTIVPGGTVTGIWWSDDGTQVLMAEQATDKIHRYTFGTPWSVAGTPTTNSTKTYNLAHDLNPYGLAFNDTGTMMYYIDPAFTIKQIPLKTPYFPDTAYSATLIVSGQDSTPKSFCTNSTRSRLYLLGQTNDDIYRYDFGENGHIATLAYASSAVDIGTRDTQGTGLECNSDATKFWLVGATNDTIYQLSNSGTGGALGTLSLDTSYAAARVDAAPNGLTLGDNGTRLYFTGINTDSIHQINFSTANTLIGFDERSFSVSSQSTTCRSLDIDKNGRYLYMYGTESLFQYNITPNGSLTSVTYDSKFLYVGSAVAGPTTPVDFSMSLNGYYFYLLDQNLDNVRVYRTPLF